MATKKPAPARKKSPKSIVKQPDINPGAKKRKLPAYKSFRIQKSIRHPGPRLANWWRLTGKSLALINANRKPLLFFFIVYGILSLVLVKGFSRAVDISGLKDTLDEVFGASTSAEIAGGFTAFGLLLSASSQSINETAQLYQVILLIVSSLAIIWLFRQQQAGRTVTIKSAFYLGMFPLVPFTLVLLVIGLQLLPAIVGNFIFTTIVSQGLAVTGIEQVLWLLLFLSMLLLSFYMLSSSVIALYVVTLPEMKPLQALREARGLVQFRRFAVMRKVLALILITLLIMAVLVLPVIFFAPAVAEWLLFIVTILAVPFVHGYLFSLYRELL